MSQMVPRFLKYQEVPSILESSTDLRREQRSNFAPPKANWRTATKRGSVLASAPCMNLGSGWNWQIHANSWIFLGPGCIHDASRTLAKRKNAIERLILRICRTKVKLVPCPHHPTGLKNWQAAPVLPMFVKKLANHCLKLLLQNLRAECSLHLNKTRDEHPAAWSMLNAQNWRNGNKEETKVLGVLCNRECLWNEVEQDGPFKPRRQVFTQERKPVNVLADGADKVTSKCGRRPTWERLHEDSPISTDSTSFAAQLKHVKIFLTLSTHADISTVLEGVWKLFGRRCQRPQDSVNDLGWVP